MWASAKSVERQIFCNRSLNMQEIQAVGFDMDYTLAQYKPETFETLAHTGTKEKLVHSLGYPEEVLGLDFDWSYMVRGLTIDKVRGNILKVDRHKYVKLAYHGFKPLAREDRLATYHQSMARESFDEPDYTLIDTLFSLAEAYLYSQIVEMKDGGAHAALDGKSYMEIYKDIRAAVDLCHRDGTLKEAVAERPEDFCYPDENLENLIRELRTAGKKTFIVTNSLWDYTNVVMNYLIGGKVGPAKDLEWLDLFDVVICGSRKPAFFSNQSIPIFEVDPASGLLNNTDNGNPMAQVGTEPTKFVDYGAGTKVYQGGSFPILHNMLGVASGSNVLYVGDHIYGDIVKSKKALGWRTMLVVPELEQELQVLGGNRGVSAELHSLRKRRDALDDQIQRIQWRLGRDRDGSKALEADARAVYEAELEALRAAQGEVKAEHGAKLQRFHEQFHPIWGSVLKTGYQNSRFASQMERFACLYTSHIGNLRYYSPMKSYRGLQDVLPHDVGIDAFG